MREILVRFVLMNFFNFLLLSWRRDTLASTDSLFFGKMLYLCKVLEQSNYLVIPIKPLRILLSGTPLLVII